jgi:anti-sigma factor RsiW
MQPRVAEIRPVTAGTFCVLVGTTGVVGCNSVREAISALLDGEVPTLAAGSVEQHLAGCGGCRDWQATAYRVSRRLRVQGTVPAPDAVADVIGAVRADRRRRRLRRSWLRFGSAVVGAGLVQLLVTVPLLMIAHRHPDGGGPLDLLGATELVIGAGFFLGALVVLWRDRGAASPDVVSLDERSTGRAPTASSTSEVA